MHHPACLQLDDHEDAERSEQQVMHHREITIRKLFVRARRPQLEGT
jgi:hypothetical protein